MSDNTTRPIPPEESGPNEPQNQEQPRDEVQKIHGVLRVRPAPSNAPPSPPTGTGKTQHEEPDGRQHIYCPRCGGANSSKVVKCRWCGSFIDYAPLPDREPSRTLFQAYKEALFHASAEGLASEVPGASWKRVWIGLLIISVMNVIVRLVVTTLFASSSRSSIFPLVPVTPGSGDTGTVAPSVQTIPFDAWLWEPVWFVATFIGSVVGFFLSALFIYWLCRRFQGVGRTGRFGQDFMVHSYLLSLVTVPISLILDLFSLVPLAGVCASFGFGLYGILLQYFAIRASMQMSRGNARTAMILQIVLLFVLFMVIFCAAILFALASFRGIFDRTFSTLVPPVLPTP